MAPGTHVKEEAIKDNNLEADIGRGLNTKRCLIIKGGSQKVFSPTHSLFLSSQNPERLHHLLKHFNLETFYGFQTLMLVAM